MCMKLLEQFDHTVLPPEQAPFPYKHPIIITVPIMKKEAGPHKHLYSYGLCPLDQTMKVALYACVRYLWTECVCQ